MNVGLVFGPIFLSLSLSLFFVIVVVVEKETKRQAVSKPKRVTRLGSRNTDNRKRASLAREK